MNTPKYPCDMKWYGYLPVTFINTIDDIDLYRDVDGDVLMVCGEPSEDRVGNETWQNMLGDGDESWPKSFVVPVTENVKDFVRAYFQLTR